MTTTSPRIEFTRDLLPQVLGFWQHAIRRHSVPPPPRGRSLFVSRHPFCWFFSFRQPFVEVTTHSAREPARSWGAITHDRAAGHRRPGAGPSRSPPTATGAPTAG